MSVSEVADLDRVHVTGTGLPAGAVQLSQGVVQSTESLAGRSLASECDLTAPNRGIGRVDATGGLSANVVVRAAIGIGTRREIDCLATDCFLVASDGEQEIYAFAPIPWSTEMDRTSRPILTLTELSFSKASGTAVVTGHGYPAGGEVNLVQCPAAGPGDGVDVDAADCLYDRGTTVTADAQGRFRTKVQLAPRFQRSSGAVVDCRAQPRTCAIAEPWPQESEQRMSRVLFSEAG